VLKRVIAALDLQIDEQRSATVGRSCHSVPGVSGMHWLPIPPGIEDCEVGAGDDGIHDGQAPCPILCWFLGAEAVSSGT